MIDGPPNDVHLGQLLGERQVQEDTMICEDLWSLSAVVGLVADGMGGHGNGGVASQLVSRVFIDCLRSAQTEDSGILLSSLHAANAELSRRVVTDAYLRGMGTTLVAAVLTKERVSWVSVGDSLLLRMREGNLERLNDDHSSSPLSFEVAGENLEVPLNLLQGPGGNQLKSALSGRPISIVDQGSSERYPGDRYLVASDGLLTLSKSSIVRAMSEDTACQAVDRLLDDVQRAKNLTQDNVSVVAIF